MIKNYYEAGHYRPVFGNKSPERIMRFDKLKGLHVSKVYLGVSEINSAVSILIELQEPLSGDNFASQKIKIQRKCRLM